MTLPTLTQSVIEALRSAGATEEMIAAAVKASGELRTPHPGGRPRKHANGAERLREHRKRRRNETSSVTPSTCNETSSVTPPRNETSSVTRDEIRDEIPMARRMALGPALRGRLEEAGQGHFDADADIEPIRALLDQGCDLELDILPVVAREVPELPRPLRNWGAPWLVREILEARDRRLARGSLIQRVDEPKDQQPDQEPPPGIRPIARIPPPLPVRRTPRRLLTRFSRQNVRQRPTRPANKFARSFMGTSVAGSNRQSAFL
jgi:hypothetical protein